MKMILKYYYTVVVMALFILIMGIVTITKTPIDIFPEIKTEPFRLYFSQAITGLNVWKENNGSYEKLYAV